MHIKFDVKEDKENNIKFLTNATGNDLIRAPLLDKGTAFSKEERDSFGLDGLIPPRVLTIEKQIEIINQRYQRLGAPYDMLKVSNGYRELKFSDLKKTLDIARFNFLRDLHDRNEILFYAFCNKYLEAVLPIIYTPTVGEAVIRFSRDTARFRGIFLSPDNIDSVGKIFDHFRFKHPSICVVTDNQGILGLGDQGVGGIDIPVGKLSLYVLGAGIRPWETMPLTLDVGTDNKQDLKDTFYLGYKSGRLHGEKYDLFIEKFINGIKEKFPDILIQWEDFSRQNAYTVLDEYRYKILSFNDDIQGTGAVALAGILNALKISNKDFKDQRFVIYGAGAGGVGIARRIAACLEKKCKMSKKQASNVIAILDSKGLVTNNRKVEDYKKQFSKDKKFYARWDIKNSGYISLQEVVKNFKPTVLIGTSGCPSHFTDEILKQMSKNTERPIIFPLSNPTSKAEATPSQIYKTTKGKAIVAAGSPFPGFKHNGKEIIIGQGNNFFIFPGVGLGVIISKGRYINDEVFTETASRLAELTPNKNIKKECVFPSISNIRSISAEIALKTTQIISNEQKTKEFTINEIKSKMWKPRYSKIKRID